MIVMNPSTSFATTDIVRPFWCPRLSGIACAAESLPPFLLDSKTLDASAVATNAGKALEFPIATIVDKKRPSPTGDPHDYVSYGRYWWPNPASTNGLPYIQRDGHPNREQMALGDQDRMDRMIDTVEILAQAWHLDHREDCARRAGEWIRAWFVTPATRVNPSFEYAQIHLGSDGNHGNKSGLIDTRHFIRLIDALRLLHGSPAFTGNDEAAVHQWFSDYLHWLTTSKNGKLEHEAANNHGSWFLSQLIAIARYLDREDDARQFAREDFARITNQFAPDGSQPLELVRQDGLSYCAFNLEAQFCSPNLPRRWASIFGTTREPTEPACTVGSSFCSLTTPLPKPGRTAS